MKRIFFGILISLACFSVYTVQAAVVHLNSGESISGKIQTMDPQTLSLESDHGFGVLQIDRGDIRLIEFDETQRDLTNKFGVGYYQRGMGFNSGVPTDYHVGSFSFKYWLNRSDSMDFQFGYTGTVNKSKKTLEILSLAARFSRVALQEGNHNLYWGLGLENVTVADEYEKLDESGFSFLTFMGLEIFPSMLPNLGISGEIGIAYQQLGDRTTLSIFNVGFPTMALRYYF